MINKYKRFKTIQEFHSYLSDKFLFVDNSTIEGLSICEDADGSYVLVYTKDVELSKAIIDSGNHPFSYAWSDDSYRVKFEKTSEFAAQ